MKKVIAPTMAVPSRIEKVHSACWPSPSRRKKGLASATTIGKPAKMATNRSSDFRSGRASSQATGDRSGRASDVAAASSSRATAVMSAWPVEGEKPTSAKAPNK